MADIVERLRSSASFAVRVDFHRTAEELHEAAAEIERLRAALREIKRLLDADCDWRASEIVDAALEPRT